jgi:hypothetical protein
MKKQPESKSSFGRTAALLLGAVAIASVGGMISLGIFYYAQQPAIAEPAVPSGANLNSWFDNGAGGRHVLQIRQGNGPVAGTRVTGTVLTDSNCDPDAQGLSHCHNIIDLGGDRRIEVVHTHLMNRHPCLAPGQRVTVTRLNADWVIAYEGQPPRS